MGVEYCYLFYIFFFIVYLFILLMSFCNVFLLIVVNNFFYIVMERLYMVENMFLIREKIGYGMGDVGCNIIFGVIMLFVNYFYIDIFGLVLVLVGVFLFLV